METKIKVLLFFYVVGILPVHAERYSSGGEAFFVGALQGLFLMFIFWIWRVIKNAKSKTSGKSKEEKPTISSNIPKPLLTPWENYKKENIELARAIELATNENLQNLSERAIFEKAATFKRMATQYNCSISDVKETVIKELLSKFDRGELQDVLERIEEKIEVESRQYSIAKENTMSYYTGLWLKEFLQINQLS